MHAQYKSVHSGFHQGTNVLWSVLGFKQGPRLNAQLFPSLFQARKNQHCSKLTRSPVSPLLVLRPPFDFSWSTAVQHPASLPLQRPPPQPTSLRRDQDQERQCGWSSILIPANVALLPPGKDPKTPDVERIKFGKTFYLIWQLVFLPSQEIESNFHSWCCPRHFLLACTWL